MTSSTRKKAFSRFSLKEAYQQLGITHLHSWQMEFTPLPASELFQHHLTRLQRAFDLEGSEEGKKLLIDAILLEVIQHFEQIKIWKGADLEGESAHGVVDYLLAANKGYLDAPFLCVVEAKKDDFEQGLAQCLVEMQACQWSNQHASSTIDIFGIVTNGSTWRFYKLTLAGLVYETQPYASGTMDIILGQLHYLFQQCEPMVSQVTP